MKVVVQVKLLPDAAQEAALRDTLTLCNQAADMVSARSHEMRVTGKQSLQRLTYGGLKAMGLPAQPAIHVARKAAGAYATLKATIKAGNPGEPGSERRVKAGGKPISFRPDGAQPYDGRCLSWQMDRRTVSIWTTAGRAGWIRFRLLRRSV